MRTGYQSAWRRRMSAWRRRVKSGGAARAAIPLGAIPAALAMVLGVVLAVSGGNHIAASQSALGTCATPSAASSAAAGAGKAPASPQASGAGNAAAGHKAPAAGSPSAGPTAGGAGKAPAGPQAGKASVSPQASGAGKAAASPQAGGAGKAPASPCPRSSASASVAGASPSASASPTAQMQNVNCDLIVPPNPLSAQGLATPWQLTGPNGNDPQGSGCTMANAVNLGAFVQATIVNPATGQLNTYEPLVTTQGTKPAVTPAVPKLAAGDVVNIMVGFNGNTLTLINSPGTNSVAQGQCVNGLGGSNFGQVHACNSPAFYKAANAAEAAGKLAIPALGTTSNGQPCPTTRSFNLIDQDQSDNVTTQYLVNGNGQTAQDNAANAAMLGGAMVVSNGSDNALLDGFVDPAVGCKPMTAPDLSNAGQPGTSQTLDELMAAKDQQAPVALVPLNDPMTLVNGAFSLQKTNLYRQGVDQPPMTAANAQAAPNPDSPANYCANMLNNQTKFIMQNKGNFAGKASPVPAMANNLFTFEATRLSNSFMNLKCANFGLKNTVKLIQNGQGVTVRARLRVMNQTPASQVGMASPSASPGGMASPGRKASPGGMASPAPRGSAGRSRSAGGTSPGAANSAWSRARMGQNPGQFGQRPAKAGL
jgi:hypothetical protein